MKRYTMLIGAALLALAGTVAPALAHPPIAKEQAAASFEQDRADILAMAGTFDVNFDMQESTRWVRPMSRFPTRFRAATRSCA